MKAIFRTADILIIESCNLTSFSKGDVIAYARDGDEDKKTDPVVHRIIYVDKNYAFTKGDNNSRPDILPVSVSNLIGKVVAFERQGKTYRVRGGMAGLMRARIGYAFRRARYLLIYQIRKFLPVKKIGDIIFIFWKPEIQKLKFSTSEGLLIKWIHRNRTIATWLPEQNLLKASFLSSLLIRSKNPN